MKRIVTLIVALIAPAWLALAEGNAEPGAKVWPQWRGPGGQGVSSAKSLPVKWSATENVKWKIEIPGKGYSSPCVWGDRAYFITAIPQGEEIPEGDPRRGRGVGPGGPPPTVDYKFEVYCLNLQDGKILWEKTARIDKPKEGVNRLKGSYANATPATDGERVYAYFGSQGLYCYDMDGNAKWDCDLGDMKIVYMNGEGSSAIVDGDRVIILWDEMEGSFITARDKKTGKPIWRTDRNEQVTWATPVVVEHAGKKQIVTSGTNRIRSYDYETGKLIWECGGLTRACIPTIVYGHDMVFATSGYMGYALKAIKLGRTGDLTDSDAIAWSLDKGTPYVPTPILYGDELYVADDKGVLSCYDAVSGKQHYERTRIPGILAMSASPVAGDGKVYFTSEDGKTVVLKAGKSLEVLATNEIPERILASPALVDGMILLRGEQHLYCVGQN
jgi:outer membrane protein assembly factor BamB